MNLDWPLAIAFVIGWVAIVLYVTRWVVSVDDRRDARRRYMAHPINHKED